MFCFRFQGHRVVRQTPTSVHTFFSAYARSGPYPFTNIAVTIETERNAPAEFLWPGKRPVLQPSVTMTLLSDCTKIQPIKCLSSRPTCFIHKFWGFSRFKPAASYSPNDSCTPDAIFTPPKRVFWALPVPNSVSVLWIEHIKSFFRYENVLFYILIYFRTNHLISANKIYLNISYITICRIIFMFPYK